MNLDQWLENVVANVPGAIYRCELRSDWEMRFMSREIEHITGHPPSDFVGNAVRTYESVIHPMTAATSSARSSRRWSATSPSRSTTASCTCLLYTSDAADD